MHKAKNPAPPYSIAEIYVNWKNLHLLVTKKNGKEIKTIDIYWYTATVPGTPCGSQYLLILHCTATVSCIHISYWEPVIAKVISTSAQLHIMATTSDLEIATLGHFILVH